MKTISYLSPKTTIMKFEGMVIMQGTTVPGKNPDGGTPPVAPPEAPGRKLYI